MISRGKFIAMGLGSILLGGLGAAVWYTKAPTAKPVSMQASTPHHYTWLLHSVETSTNPMAYTSVLRTLADPSVTEDASLRSAAEKLLAIDTDAKSYQCRHEVPALEKALYQVLVAYYQATSEDPPTAKKIKQEAEAFLYERLHHPQPTYYALPFKKKRLGRLDKRMRAQGMTRFAPLFYDRALVAWLQAHGTAFDTESFAGAWVQRITPWLASLRGEEGSDAEEEALRRDYLFTFLFDLHSTKRLFDHGGVEAWVKLVQTLQRGPLGDVGARNRCVVEMYKAQNPSIVCVRGCDAALREALAAAGYEGPASSNEGADNGGSLGTVVLYKQALFDVKDVTVVEVAALGDAEETAEGNPRRGTHKAVIHKVRHQGMVWVVCVWDAGNGGEEAVAFLEGLLAWHKRLEEAEGQKVLLLLGMEGHASDGSEEAARRWETFMEKVEDLVAPYDDGHVRIRKADQEDRKVGKERSTFQMQLSKVHVVDRDIMECLVLSKGVEISGEDPKRGCTSETTYHPAEMLGMTGLCHENVVRVSWVFKDKAVAKEETKASRTYEG